MFHDFVEWSQSSEDLFGIATCAVAVMVPDEADYSHARRALGV